MELTHWGSMVGWMGLGMGCCRGGCGGGPSHLYIFIYLSSAVADSAIYAAQTITLLHNHLLFCILVSFKI